MPSFISEDDIEQALIAKLREKWSETYNFESLNCFTTEASDLNASSLATLGRDCMDDGQEWPSYISSDLNDKSGRSDKRDVILADRVRSAAKQICNLGTLARDGWMLTTGRSAHPTIDLQWWGHGC